MEGMLTDDQSKTSRGQESLMSIGQSEIIDSTDQFDQYLRAKRNEIDIEEGQMLVV